MNIKLYNTLTRKEENFTPLEGNEVRIYSCGPTVYSYAHIGNFRSYVFMDNLRRVLKYNGYDLKHVMNITDVGHLESDADEGEDKMEKAARKENKNPYEIAEFYTKAFFEDMDKLNIDRPEIIAKATEHIPEMLEYVKEIIKNGYAYETSKGIYFDISKLDKYPVLSNRNLDDQIAGARVEVDPEKRNPYDFALWIKAPENHLMKWESPWGVGYPGWHIECSSISIKHLGEYMDIHCGGVDNIFPHHTNEIAQSESYLGHKWCNYWFHVNHLKTNGGKMSKSKGEFLTVSLLEEKGYNPMVYRMFCLQSHYRKPLEFSYEALDNVATAYEKLLKRIKAIPEEGEVNADQVAAYHEKFGEAVGNDMNTSMGLTIVYDLLKEDFSGATKRAILADLDTVLSLELTKPWEDAGEEVDEELSAFVEGKIAERAAAKKEKDFAKADAIRDELKAKGILIKDTREGVVWEKIGE